MKAILISVFLLITTMNGLTVQETESMAGTFNGYEDSIFSFTDTDGYSMEFNHISDEAKVTIDLTDNKYIGKLFQVTFTSESEIDDQDEEMTVNTITAIKILE